MKVIWDEKGDFHCPVCQGINFHLSFSEGEPGRYKLSKITCVGCDIELQITDRLMEHMNRTVWKYRI